MKNIYDNGMMILGVVYDVKEYIARNCEDVSEIKELIEDLEDLDADDIVCVNYDNPMGYSINYWKKDDIVLTK